VAILRYNPGAFPRATMALVALNVAFAVGDIATNSWFEQALYARGIDIYSGQWWRIPGCTLVHANLMHIAFNAYGIYILGRILEQLQGWRTMLVVYVVSALGGAGLGAAFTDPAIPMLGASGAAYGLMGAVLGFFYVKTGSLRGLWEVPMSRHLVIWFLIGIWISLQPGISLLGHAGGFVPGVLLGIYYEYRYERRADVFHHASVIALVVVVLGFCVYAAVPWHRSTYIGVQALRAFEARDFARGDQLLDQAKTATKTDTDRRLATHLDLWREDSRRPQPQLGVEELRGPLTKPGAGDSARPRYLELVSGSSVPESLEPTGNAP
jgi:membrane associated rhomboid family serine protease